jgi:hypothetical protein
MKGELVGSLSILEENGLVEIQGFVKMLVENEAKAW